MNTLRSAVSAAALALVAASPISARAQSSSDLYQPVVTDVHTRSPSRDLTDVMAIQFGKVVTGGFSYNYRDGVDDLSSAGFFFSPDLPTEDQVVFATSFNDLGNGDTAFELQGKYTLESGLGFSTGFYRPGMSGQSDVFFARVNYELPLAGGKLTLSPVGQKNADRDYDLGAYALYTYDSLLMGGGFDGEEVRAVVNYHTPTPLGPLRPAAEVFFVDNSAGDVDGAEVVLMTGTVSYSGGFLDPAFSVGRASGPSNVTFANPVSFTTLAWNRAHDVWEYGNYMNWRILSLDIAGNRSTDYSAVIYPAQLIDNYEGRLERIYVGARHVTSDVDSDADGAIAGYYGTLFGKFSGGVSFTYDLQDEQGELVFGLVYLH
jgi:hypothetical protein